MGALVSTLLVTAMGTLYSIASRFSSGGKPIVHFAPKPALLQAKKRKDSDEVEELSLQILLETRCPSLFSEFRPVWWLAK
jgi:hypothetical protein